MKPTLTPEQRKKISQVAGIIGRIGGSRNTPAQKAARHVNGKRVGELHRQKVAAKAA